MKKLKLFQGSVMPTSKVALIINSSSYLLALFLKSSAFLILSHHLWRSCVNSGLKPHKCSQIAKPSTEHVCKTQDIYPCLNTFYRTLPNQLDGISPLTVVSQHIWQCSICNLSGNKFMSTANGVANAQKSIWFFVKSWNRFSNWKLKSDIK